MLRSHWLRGLQERFFPRRGPVPGKPRKRGTIPRQAGTFEQRALLSGVAAVADTYNIQNDSAPHTLEVLNNDQLGDRRHVVLNGLVKGGILSRESER